jgi:CTP:molybdopterin cytidylyltransferase MocA
MIDGILPAAGLATRMRGLPKFLLPSGLVIASLTEKSLARKMIVA